MPRVSVVVPIYNVETYLEPCLESLAAQTFADLEVVMVNDGSTDRSPAIAEAFSTRDPRFKLVHRENGGLSAARNTGIDVASGEFLAFVDSDDLVTPAAYELLVGALDESGSDFASGNVHRLSRSGTRQARFLARTFAETRLKTHITRDRLLLHDRTAWNKLWRRAFWDREGRRFPEGRIYEDTPVTLPLHFAARSVDVLSDVVYYWRTREGADLSITQRRTEPRSLNDRLTAIEEVSEYLAAHGLKREKRWYDASVVADDLKYFLNVLDEADDEFRALFFARVNHFLDGVSPRAFRRLRANERLKWHLVRRRMLPELLEILRFQREDAPETTPVRVRGHWYLDHPFRTDRSLKIPQSLFRVDRELQFSTGLDVLDWQDGKLRIEGWAYVDGIGAPEKDSQRVTLTAVRPGRLRPVKLRLGGVRLRAQPVRREDLVHASGTELADVSWAGFKAALPAGKLKTKGRWLEGRWDLHVTVRTGRVFRARSRFTADTARPLRAAETIVADGVVAATAPEPTGEIKLLVHTEWAAVREHRLEDGAVVLSGEAHLGARELQARRRGGGGRKQVPLERSGARFTARLPLAALGTDDASWDLYAGRRRVTLALGVPFGAWVHGGREFALERAMDGGATLSVRPPRATVTEAAWTPGGALELAGELRAEARELILAGRTRLERHAFPLEVAGGAFRARLTPAAIPTPAGELPLRTDAWDVLVGTTPVSVGPGLYDDLPLRQVVDHKPFRFGSTPEGDAILLVERDLDDEERGRRQQRRLRATAYAGRRTQPLRDAVVFLSFNGREYSDNPRAISEELARRGSPLALEWVVRDGRFRVPDGARKLRAGSREHYEAMATARFVVANDHFPWWFERRADQVALQTWHGMPLKTLGADSPAGLPREWERRRGNWQYLLSPGAFATPILTQAFPSGADVLETGLPRTDRLVRGEGREAVRRALGVPDGARAVLYAPTYRDDARDPNGRYRLDRGLDVERLRAALDDDTVVLFRNHRFVIDPAPAGGPIRDVTRYPDATELLLAADVLVTDYTSLPFDFAVTGRPILLFAYDLEEYRDEVRGLYLDLETRAPGPLLRTTDELAEALRDVAAATAPYAERYRAFAAEFCALADGGASARVADRLFR